MARGSRSAAGLALAVAALAAAGCERGASAGAPERLVLVDLRQPATSLTFVAESAGCFRREGLEVDRRTVDLGRDALTALLGDARAADVAIAYETPTLGRFQADARLRVLTTLHTSAQNTRLVARRDRGVRAPGDLRGKRIGSTPGSNTGFFVATLLTFAGIEPSEVTIVDLEPAQAIAALAAGTIDAAALFDPFAERAKSSLGDAVELHTDLYTEYSLVATRADVVAARRPALLALLRSLACAERAVREQPEETFAAVRAAFPDRAEADVRTALGRVRRGLGLDAVLLTVLRREGEWLWRGSHPPGVLPPDAARLVEPALLDEVDPEAVNLPELR